MIIKMVGMGIVMLSSTLIGLSFAECMASRERELLNLADAVELIINELSYTMAPIRDIVLSITPRVRGLAKEMFELMCKRINAGDTAGEAWIYALAGRATAMSFKKEDADCLGLCSSLLDAYEIDEQKTRLTTLKGKLISLADEAAESKKKNSRVVRMLGVYGGVLLCVIIF